MLEVYLVQRYLVSTTQTTCRYSLSPYSEHIKQSENRFQYDVVFGISQTKPRKGDRESREDSC